MTHPHPTTEASPGPCATGPAREIVEAHEAATSAQRRSQLGVHYTPPALASFLVELALDAVRGDVRTVCDPSCGAGSILLAAADALVRAGADPARVVDEQLLGIEVDPQAAAGAREALSAWAAEHGRTGCTPRIVVADALDLPADTAPAGGVDVVVGNPPFRDQLDRRTARSAEERARLAARLGPLGPYGDDASVHLLAACGLVRPGGVVAMLQPRSFLASRDTSAVRARLLDQADLVALWSADEQPFRARVAVCAPVLRRRAGGARGRRVGTGEAVAVHWGWPERRAGRSVPPRADDSWSPLLAALAGVPPVDDPSSVVPGPGEPGPLTVGGMATVTAGFRDEYYAVCGALREAGPADLGGRPGEGAAKVVSVGMIDPCSLHWGARPFRIGGRDWVRPVLDPAAVTRTGRAGRWVAARRRPKVLVGSQGRLLEAVVDPDGAAVPLTPVISVEVDPEHLWHVAAALMAPPVVAGAVAARLGTGLSPTSVRWSAASVAVMPLPADRHHWDRGAALVRALHEERVRDRDAVRDLALAMSLAHGCEDDAVVSWWVDAFCARTPPAPADVPPP